MPKRRALHQGEPSTSLPAKSNDGGGSSLAAAIEALAIAEEEVMSYREYAEAVVIVARDGRKLTCPKSSPAGHNRRLGEQGGSQ